MSKFPGRYTYEHPWAQRHPCPWMHMLVINVEHCIAVVPSWATNMMLVTILPHLVEWQTMIQFDEDMEVNPMVATGL